MDVATHFRVGDKVVYPNHGVGVIEHISCRAIGNTSQEFYLLKIEASNLRVMVPFGNADNVGMRPVAKTGETTRMLAFLQTSETLASSTDWKWRFKENSDKMRAGSLLQVAEVLKSLLQLHQVKPLSFREKKMLDRAITLLMSELATANGLSAEAALSLLQQALAKAALTLPALEAEA